MLMGPGGGVMAQGLAQADESKNKTTFKPKNDKTIRLKTLEY